MFVHGFQAAGHFGVTASHLRYMGVDAVYGTHALEFWVVQNHRDRPRIKMLPFGDSIDRYFAQIVVCLWANFSADLLPAGESCSLREFGREGRILLRVNFEYDTLGLPAQSPARSRNQIAAEREQSQENKTALARLPSARGSVCWLKQLPREE